jgi:methionine-rich copper-binding protein CopC
MREALNRALNCLSQLIMRIGRAAGWTVLATVLVAGCAGNGNGLDQNGNPIGSSSSSNASSSASSSSSGTLTADFTSIQDNVFTPICTRCHIGASAPEGLQLDAAHSYGLLVGVPSVEQPSVLRVDPGDPDNSYLIQKLEGAPTISGGQMPLGGPYLPQATIDVIAQWITDGATMSPATMSQLMAQRAEHAIFEVVATSPPDTAVVSAPVHTIAVAFSAEVDAALVNATTITLQAVTPTEFPEATQPPLPITTALAAGNPATVVIVPTMALGPGTYRVTVRGTGGGAIASVSGVPLDADYDFVFTVGRPR